MHTSHLKETMASHINDAPTNKEKGTRSLQQLQDNPADDTPTLEAEIMSVGEWNGEIFSHEDLHEISHNFELLRNELKPPLKFGHDEDQTLLGQSDGDPALGWVDGLRVTGGKLIATFIQVPSVVRQAIASGRWRKISAEIYFEAEHQGKKLGKVLKAVALLGADLPAVTNLKDLSVFLTADWPSGFRSRGSRVFTLPLGVVTPKIPQQASYSTTSPSISEKQEKAMPSPKLNGDEQTELSELRAYKLQQEERLRQTRQVRQAKAFSNACQSAAKSCDFQVAAGKLSPALRDSLIEEISRQAKHFAEGRPLPVSLDWVMEFIQQSQAILPQNEIASSVRPASLDSSSSAAQQLAAMAEEKMHELKISYSEAAQHVLRTHPQLAESYRNFTLQPQ